MAALPSPLDRPADTACTRIVRAGLGDAFERSYRDLRDLYGSELNDDLVLNELAELFTDLLMSPTATDEDIARCAAVLEELCDASGIDAVEKVYDQVLCLMPLTALERARVYLGPAAEHLLETMEDEADLPWP